MSDFISGLIVKSENRFDEAARLKGLFFTAWKNNSGDKLERFEEFFTTISGVILASESSMERVSTMCLYIICQFQGVLISKGLKETEINNVLLSDFYEIDNAKNIQDMLECLKKTCLKLLMMEEQEAVRKNYSAPIQNCINYIDNHVTEKVNLKVLCQKINYSYYYLSHQFYKEVGVTIVDYIRNKKVEKAQILLGKGDSINAVSDQLNYSSVSYFIQSFKKETGITPKQFQSWVNSKD